MRPYQIIITLISALMVWQGITLYIKKQRGQTFLKLLVRTLVWGGMGGIALFPGISNTLAHAIGIEGNVHAVIIIGFVLLFLMIFKLLATIERIESQITSLVRREALRDIEILQTEK